MPLTSAESAPGNRLRTEKGDEADVVARIPTDQGPYVILNRADDGSFLGLISEGELRDQQDVEHVGSTVTIKQEAVQKQEDAAAQKQAEEIAARRAERAGQTPANAPA